VQTVWIEMELLSASEWMPLSTRIRGGHVIGEATILRVAHQLLLAVGHLHAHGVIHRDLKSSNVMIRRSAWDVKIIDLGFSTDDPRIAADDIRGTAQYLAPEVFREPPRPQTNKADVWALGIIVYEMSTGSVPFPVDPIRSLRQINRIKFPANQIASETIRSLLRCCLAVDPLKRPSVPDLIARFFPSNDDCG
jgi:serine/threonine protein kinase